MIRIFALSANIALFLLLGLSAGPACLGDGDDGQQSEPAIQNEEQEQNQTQTQANAALASPPSSDPIPCRTVSDPGFVFGGGQVMFEPMFGTYFLQSPIQFPGYNNSASIDCGFGTVTNPGISRTDTGAALNAYLQNICNQPSYTWGLHYPRCQQALNAQNQNQGQVEEYWTCSYSCSGTIYVRRRNPEYPEKTAPIFETHPAAGAAAMESETKWGCCDAAQSSAHTQIAGQVSAHWRRFDVENVSFDYGYYCAGQYLACGQNAVKKTRIRY